jgi:Flp pilus assembly protein TadD
VKFSPPFPGGQTPAEIRSRMYFFFALHWKAQGDADKHRDYLYKARDSYPADIDVLIALYKLPKQSKQQLEKTRVLIKSAAAELHEQAKQAPADPAPYNQYAWLIGNTEGDFEKAMKFSRKSIALRPDRGGYYDTLAHIYVGKGDYENAVKYQEKAAKLQPHSGLIKKKLELFRKTLLESKKKEGSSDGQ